MVALVKIPAERASRWWWLEEDIDFFVVDEIRYHFFKFDAKLNVVPATTTLAGPLKSQWRKGELSMAKLKTGRHTSALKANRQSVKHAEHNLQIRSKIRTLARKVETAVAGKDATAAKTLLNEAFAAWDKAAKTGIVHHRAASRKKARLASRVSGLSTAKA